MTLTTINPPAAKSLADLEVGGRAVLERPAALTPVVLRLVEMGLTPGTPIVLTRRAPFGDPLEVSVRGTRVCLRRAEASLFRLEPSEAGR